MCIKNFFTLLASDLYVPVGVVACMWDSSQPDLTRDMAPYLSNRYLGLQYIRPQPKMVQYEFERVQGGCTSHAIMGGFMGTGMGLLMGGFFHSMQPMDNIDTTLSTWEQTRLSYRGFGQACFRMARNFGKIGVVYGAVECCLERERASKDVPNAMYAGCVTGGILAFQAGPQAMAFGCAGFAAFSAVIESFMMN